MRDSLAQRFEEMLRIDPIRHEVRSLRNHQRQHVFTALVDDDDIIEINYPVLRTGMVSGGVPTGKQSIDRASSQPALKNPSLLLNSSIGGAPVVSDFL
jgi:hypothetical protein